VNGVLGVGGILGAGILVALRAAREVRQMAPGEATSRGSRMLFVLLGGLFLLGEAGFLLFALAQVTTRIRVFARGLVWRRFGARRVVLWAEVADFGRGEAAAETLTTWRMLLHSGERLDFHSALYNRTEFTETMERIAELVEETRRRLG
jgi:hypothetical protein